LESGSRKLEAKKKSGRSAHSQTAIAPFERLRSRVDSTPKKPLQAGAGREKIVPRIGDMLGLGELMERYIDGDKRAFARLHARLSPRLKGFLLKLVRDEPAADDLVQLTLLKAHLARERFVKTGGDPDGAVQGWYFAIARNVAMDHLRERYRAANRRAVAPTEAESGESDALLQVADDTLNVEEVETAAEAEREIVAQVRDAIALLPPGQREVVELHKLRGMSMAEVAARLRVREGAVRVRAHRAYRALARLLEPKALPMLLVLLVLAGIGGGV
jgi:RNA polymerase sigma-70 factor (ECF subfamily)